MKILLKTKISKTDVDDDDDGDDQHRISSRIQLKKKKRILVFIEFWLLSNNDV